MKRPEQSLQRAVVHYLQLLENQGKLVFFHPFNGGYRKPTEAKIYKGLGVKPGVSDIIIIFPPSGRVGCIELKASSGLTENQKKFLGNAAYMGAMVAVARSVTEVGQLIASWSHRARLGGENE